MSVIRFDAKLQKIGSWTILQFPKSASAKLPSRGMVLVEGTINNSPTKLVLEPDGKGSHWFKVDNAIGKAAKAKVGDSVALAVEPSQEWPEPQIPADVKKGLANDPKAHAIWKDITPMARWDWIRWIRSTNSSETRQRRIDVTRSKLKSGTRRACCFNRNLCTEPRVSHNWVLLEPTT